MKWLFVAEILVLDTTAQQSVTLEILILFKQLPVALIPTVSGSGSVLSLLPACRPPVQCLLNNASKHSGNAFTSRSIVVISHVGIQP